MLTKTTTIVLSFVRKKNFWQKKLFSQKSVTKIHQLQECFISIWITPLAADWRRKEIQQKRHLHFWKDFTKKLEKMNAFDIWRIKVEIFFWANDNWRSKSVKNISGANHIKFLTPEGGVKKVTKLQILS